MNDRLSSPDQDLEVHMYYCISSLILLFLIDADQQISLTDVIINIGRSDISASAYILLTLANIQKRKVFKGNTESAEVIYIKFQVKVTVSDHCCDLSH